MKKSKYLWITIGVGSFFLLLMILLSSILDIGDRLSKISEYLEYGFYAVAFLLLFLLVINPARIIMFSPSLSISTEMESTFKAKKVCKKVSQNILDNNELTEEEIFGLENYKNLEELKKAINNCYDKTIKKRISNIIYNNAKTVMISTAISQNATIDMYSVISINLKMIKEIVLASGFRPSYKNLGKLSLNVLTTALIAEGLENINVEDILPNSTMQSLGEIPFIKPIMSSVVQGASNALLTLRIGFVTRKYLFSETGIKKSQIRAEAFKESVKMLPKLIAEVATFFPSKIVKLFTKKDAEVKTN